MAGEATADASSWPRPSQSFSSSAASSRGSSRGSAPAERHMRTLRRTHAHRAAERRRVRPMIDANLLIHEWVVHFNRRRPHGALGHKTPREFRLAWKADE
ncbi:MAG: integrase core domain-containing protein [Thermoleophilia bacterium]|nr:integrase core domain-containing protein [Thermoleophilia bacterium]